MRQFEEDEYIDDTEFESDDDIEFNSESDDDDDDDFELEDIIIDDIDDDEESEQAKKPTRKPTRSKLIGKHSLAHDSIFKGKKINHDEEYDELDWQNVKIGSNVLLKKLNQEVTILSTPDKNDNVIVQMGLIKTKIKKNKLAIYEERYKKKPQLQPTPVNSFEFKKQELSNTLDLRGYRVEDALDSIEFFLDKASLTNLTPVYIIHGHGTGALKSAIRDFLSTSPYVAKYRPGEPSEGSDGVSVVDIN